MQVYTYVHKLYQLSFVGAVMNLLHKNETVKYRRGLISAYEEVLVLIASVITWQAVISSSLVIISGGAKRMALLQCKNQSVITPLAIQVSIIFLLRPKLSNSKASIKPLPLISLIAG